MVGSNGVLRPQEQKAPKKIKNPLQESAVITGAPYAETLSSDIFRILASQDSRMAIVFSLLGFAVGAVCSGGRGSTFSISLSC